MPETNILVKLMQFFLPVLAFVFSFLGYAVAIRPQIQSKMSDYALGFIEGGILLFILAALPLTYALLAEREKKKKTAKR